MKKRHSISQRKCEQGLVAFYGYIADEEIGTKLLLCGPKANLIGDGYEVEVENGFVIEGE